MVAGADGSSPDRNRHRGAHQADLAIQDQYTVDYRQQWVAEGAGKVFCLVDAPDRETAVRVHREVHGLEAQEQYEVTQGA